MIPPATAGQFTGSITGRTYTNPLVFADGEVPTNPDPFVMRFRGRYWCYSTGECGVNVSTSPDLVDWHHLGLALEVTGRRHFWAPCVVYAEGLFWMYFSNRPAGSDDPHEEVLQVATSTSPEGPFEVSRRLFETFSIDPHVVRDSTTGGYVMFYSTNETTGLDADGAGTSIVVDRLVAMDELTGSPRPVVVPTIEQEIFERNRFGDGRDWYTVEGASYFTRQGCAYLTYSGNAYVGENYFIGYAHADLDGPADQLRWSKHPSDFEWSPLVRRSQAVEGTGHNSIVRAPNLVDDWIVYHGRDAGTPLDTELEQRVMRIDPLFYDGAVLATPAPTTGAQERPAAATVHDNFDGPGLASSWTPIAGDFVIEPSVGHEAGLVRSGRDQMSLLVHERQVRNYVCEVHVQALRSDAGARFGVAPVFHDVDDCVVVLLDTVSASVEVRRIEQGMTRPLASAELGILDPSVWHLIRVERTFSEITVHVDGLEVVTTPIGDDRAAAVGLVSIGTCTSFSAFTLTEHLDLRGDLLRYLPKVLRADRTIDVTSLGAETRSLRSVVLEGGSSAPAVVITHEVELLGPHGTVEIEPVVTDHVRVSIHLTADAIRICLKHGDEESYVARVENDRLRLSVRTTVRDDAAVVRLGAQTWLLPLRTSGNFTQRIQLSASRLRGLEMTSIGEGI